MRIYLIGLPGCGKTTVGKELAKSLKYDFIDLDKEIVRRENKTIDELFAVSEAYFRDKETEALKSTNDLVNTVISCGGGIVERDINKSLMNGVVIYLDSPLSEIEFRLKSDSTSRPVSKKLSIYELFDRRNAKYEDFKTFKVSSNIVSDTVKQIKRGLKKYEKNSSN